MKTKIHADMHLHFIFLNKHKTQPKTDSLTRTQNKL